MFKEHTIRRLAQRLPKSSFASPTSAENPDKTQFFKEPTIEDVLQGVEESQKYYALNKLNQNSCHPGEIDGKTGLPNEE